MQNHKKKVHNIHDKSYRDLYSKSQVASELFKSILNPELANEINPNNLTLINKSFITADYEELESDIVYKANIHNNEVIFYILLEFQSTIDYRMPLRLLLYMCEIIKSDVVNLKHRKYDKSLKFPAVIPIVLYNGEDIWNVPTEFKEMINGSELLDNNVLNFSYHVLDISHDENFNKSNLLRRNDITSAIFLLDQKIDAKEFFERIKLISLYFNSLSDEQMKALKKWIRNTVVDDLAKPAIEILDANKEDVNTMVARNTFILDEMKNEAKKEGKTTILIKQLNKKFKTLPKNVEESLENLTEEKIDEIATDIFDIDTIDDLLNRLI